MTSSQKIFLKEAKGESFLVKGSTKSQALRCGRAGELGEWQEAITGRGLWSAKGGKGRGCDKRKEHKEGQGVRVLE